MRRTLTLLLAPAICAAGLLVAGPAQAWTGCSDGADPGGFDPAANRTKRTAVVYGRTIELRYNSNRCAWGKISNGRPGDEVWVDRSYDGGTTWQGKLGEVRIRSGRDVHTSAFNDAGVVMRACGKAGDRSLILCTSWY